MVRFLVRWLVLSIPLGISLGKMLKAHRLQVEKESHPASGRDLPGPGGPDRRS